MALYSIYLFNPYGHLASLVACVRESAYKLGDTSIYFGFSTY